MRPFRDSIQAAYGEYLGRYFAGLVADTPAIQSFIARDRKKAQVWVPGRMIDDVNSMIEAWRKADVSGGPKATPLMPVMLVAMARDYEPAPPDIAVRLQNDPIFVKVPSDPLGRILQLRTAQRSIRTQVVVMATDMPTADSLMMQLGMFCGSFENRRFDAEYPVVGTSAAWSVTIESPDFIAPSQPLEQEKNLAILAADIVLRPVVPVFNGPRPGEPHDGQGAGTADDPHGYPPLREIDIDTDSQPSRTIVTVADDKPLRVQR